MVRRALIVALLGASFACAGTSDERLSRSEFVERADGICARSDAKTDSVPVPRDPSLREIARFLEDTLPTQRTALEDFEELNAPEDLEREVERYITALRSALEDLEDAQEAARNGDRAPYEDAQGRAQAQFPEIRERAGRLGLQICSEED